MRSRLYCDAAGGVGGGSPSDEAACAELPQEQRGTTDVHLAGNHAALEQLFRARVIAFLVEAGLLPLHRARMLRGWVHSGFQVF